MRRRQAGIGVAALAASTGLYFLFAGQIGLSEAYAGVPLALAASGYALALAAAAARPMRLPLRAYGAILRGCGALIPDAMRAGRVFAAAILRRPARYAGQIVDQPFRLGGDDPHDAGRRAACTLALSLAPNGFVLYATGDSAVAMHRLAPASPAADREWPA